MIINNKKIFFLLAGYLMRVPDNDVRNQLVDTVKSFYISIAPEELLDGMELLSKPKPRTFNSDIYFSRLSLSEGSFMASLYLHLICFSAVNLVFLHHSDHIFPFYFILVHQLVVILLFFFSQKCTL